MVITNLKNLPRAKASKLGVERRVRCAALRAAVLRVTFRVTVHVGVGGAKVAARHLGGAQVATALVGAVATAHARVGPRSGADAFKVRREARVVTVVPVLARVATQPAESLE